MLSIGILFDFLIDFTEVLSGDGGVITTSCLHFLVTANILNKSDVGDYSYNNVNSTHPHTPNSIAGSGSNTAANRAYTYDANVDLLVFAFLHLESLNSSMPACIVCMQYQDKELKFCQQ
jgi:hypothetical protein